MVKKGFSIFELVFYVLIACLVYKTASSIHTSIKNQLEKISTECISELEEYTIVQLNNKPCYFMYDKKEDGMLRFDEYPLENDRNFDNIFFDQKEDVKDRLDFFINNRQ